MSGLNDSWAKLGWAEAHADTLQREGSIFEKSDAVSIISDNDTQSSDHIFKLQVSEEPPLQNWGLIIGDILHNLHSALDCLTWQLAVVKLGEASAKKRRSSIYFPFAKSPSAFRDHSILPCITETHCEMLSSVQPYQRGYEILTTLKTLSTHDKHRIIHPVFLIEDEFIINARPIRDCEVIRIVREKPGPFEDGRKLARVQARATGPNPEVESYSHLSGYIALRDGRPIQEIIAETAILVKTILRTFEPTLSPHLL